MEREKKLFSCWKKKWRFFSLGSCFSLLLSATLEVFRRFCPPKFLKDTSLILEQKRVCGHFQITFLLDSFSQFFTNYLYFIVSPLARHLFGAWTLLSSTIRLLCSYYIHEKGIYLATMFTFIVAFLLYGYQHFVAKTISFRNALSPFLFASISFTLMTFHLLTKN